MRRMIWAATEINWPRLCHSTSCTEDADAQVKFVDQSRGLQGWGAVFVLKVVRGQPPQVLIDQTGQLLQCALRAVMPLVQPECNTFETQRAHNAVAQTKGAHI